MAFTATPVRWWHCLSLVVVGILLCTLPLTASGTVRIAQTHSAGDNILLIDPATNKIVGEISGIEKPHGVQSAPDGTRIYVTNESEDRVDVVDTKTLKVIHHIPTSGNPHNLAISKDGKRLYVAIQETSNRERGGGVDIIDTASLKLVKTLAGEPVHNTWVTPDGKYVVAGCNQGGPNLYYITVIDQKTEEPVWTHFFKTGVRPLTFETKPDGSTNRIFAQLSSLHGFVIVDFDKRREVGRVEFPNDVPLEKQESAATGLIEGGSTPTHGIRVSPDNKTLAATSMRNSRVYLYSLPDLKLLASIPVGRSPYWITFTPDSKTAYAANAMSGDVSVIDIASRKEVTRIKVGQTVPKRVEAVLIDEAAPQRSTR